jgi:hypothetical protein
MKHFYLFRSGAKALCLLALVAFTTTTAKAELIFQESFDRTIGTLNKGTSQDNMSTNTTDWWSFSGSSSYISVVEGSLSYADYVTTAIGNKVELKSGSGADDLRQFSSITSGKVYAAAIINVDSLKNSNTADYFFCLGDATASKMYARLQYVKSDAGFKLGINKNNESGIGYSETVYNTKTNYLVVIEYQFVDGDKNDTVRLYVNPTKDTKTATAECVQVKNNTSGSNTMGAANKDDASKIASVNLRQGTNTPGRVYVDEIKVATAWADLFPASSGEGDGGETTKTPEITSSESLLFGGNAFLDETYTATFIVSGKNLKGDITLESDNSEVTLSHSTISQADAEAEGGVTVTATLKPVTTGAKGSAGITLKSDGANDVVVAASWAVIERTKVTTIAELKEAEKTASTSDYFFFTGEAVVTYAEKPSFTQFYYIEDATGAVRLEETVAIESGDKIKDFTISMNEDQTHSFYILADPTIVSKNNELTPQVVTLETLSNNGADYFWELVKVEGVTLDKTDAQYIAGQNKISQDETTINLNLTSDNTLVGTDKPTKADVVGISYYDTGLVIRARSAADVTAKPEGTTTAIATAQNGEMLCYSTDGTLHIDNATSNVAIYSLTGICVARLNAAEHIAISLPQGIYAVKANGATTKVVVK